MSSSIDSLGNPNRKGSLPKLAAAIAELGSLPGPVIGTAMMSLSSGRQYLVTRGVLRVGGSIEVLFVHSNFQDHFAAVEQLLFDRRSSQVSGSSSLAAAPSPSVAALPSHAAPTSSQPPLPASPSPVAPERVTTRPRLPPRLPGPPRPF